MSKKIMDCIDAGSDYCPCYLAETGDCIVCSLIRGDKFCNCNWTGTCIYNEYMWNGEKAKNLRGEYICKLINKESLDEYTKILTIKIPQKAYNSRFKDIREPGSYVFIRNIKDNSSFNVPMSVMHVDSSKNTIEIAYRIVGIKTKAIDKIQNNLILTGPFSNAILGIKNIKKLYQGTTLFLVRGISQAPSVLLAQRLIEKNNRIVIGVDNGIVKQIFMKKYLDDKDVAFFHLDYDNYDKSISPILNKIEKLNLIFIGGSNSFKEKMKNIIERYNLDVPILYTNNNKICCGEGICGACIVEDDKGNKIRTCKANTKGGDFVD
ncbi:sulfide/dihydroorotate dehydrogenase-like FAD/NAD-binding protein [Clostridiisalibacter paucivorans]|uniref:sulfide/dihydroorotate dehydrogenase-like FAD/NAD-binding protein n=1 Tax=Clostridiisalibacter paucivorans TaxID=408753 RepID=UPI00047ABF40|nr:sulfide/dihydroorotate dehydrogenase-like FAD/NAD-binding protein [Clostridiisalibacter paucivorans]